MSSVFSFNIRLGLAFVVQVSCLSAIAVLSLLIYITYNAVKARLSVSSPRLAVSTSYPTKLHTRIYFISMLISDLTQATGGIMNTKWVADAAVMDGQFCTAQSILKEMGDVGVALAALAIAIHTFCHIVLHWQPQPSLKLPVLVVAGIWTFIALIIGISAATHKGKDYWGDTGYWCWITGAYPKQRILLEYLWMWLACFLNFVLYIPIALTIRGNLHVNGFNIHWGRRDNKIIRTLIEGRQDIDKIAIKMLFYPLIYTITVLPVAIARWLAFQDQYVPFGATIFADMLFCSSGLFNALLFIYTRPALLSLPETERIKGKPEILPGMTFSFHPTRVQWHTSGTISSITTVAEEVQEDLIELQEARRVPNDEEAAKFEEYRFSWFPGNMTAATDRRGIY